LESGRGCHFNMKQKQYLVQYLVPGLRLIPWNPSCIVYAETAKEARRAVAVGQSASWSHALGYEVNVQPLVVARYHNPLQKSIDVAEQVWIDKVLKTRNMIIDGTLSFPSIRREIMKMGSRLKTAERWPG